MTIEQKGPGGVSASYGSRDTSNNKFDTGSSYDTGLYVDKETKQILSPDGEPVGGGVVEGDLYIVQSNEDRFAALPLNEDDEIIANIGHRRNTLSNLLSLDGVPGEISIPTDVDGFVVHNGVAGQAKFYRRLDNDNTLGANSVAIGNGASTSTLAANSLAIGSGAEATVAGQVAFGSALANVKTSRFTCRTITTDTTANFFTTNGSTDPEDLTALISFPARPGLYDMTWTVLVREGTTGNFARLERRFMAQVASNGSTSSIVGGAGGVITPTADVLVNLSGLSLSFSMFPGRIVYATATGQAGKTLTWAAQVDVVALG